MGNQPVGAGAVAEYRTRAGTATVELVLKTVLDEFGRFVCIERVQ
jgi:hypothetical protein